MATVPTFDDMMNPLIQALRNLGGSASIEEMPPEVAEIMALSDDQVEQLHDPERGSQTELEYRLAWTRTYLKKFGILENSSRGVWALTPDGRKVGAVNPIEVKRFVQCKRYRGSVGVGVVRDFRGAMVGRADKGLLITTGNFTREAEREATRDGAPAIDLIDGDLLVEKLKQLELGVTTRVLKHEEVEIDREWFVTM